MRKADRKVGETVWLSFLGIQVVWLLLVVLTPIAASLYPSKIWLAPFGCVTIAGGLHLVYFRREYDVLLRKLVRFSPRARYLVPARREAIYLLLFGIGYALFGVVSLTLVLVA